MKWNANAVKQLLKQIFNGREPWRDSENGQTSNPSQIFCPKGFEEYFQVVRQRVPQFLQYGVSKFHLETCGSNVWSWEFWNYLLCRFATRWRCCNRVSLHCNTEFSAVAQWDHSPFGVTGWELKFGFIKQLQSSQSVTDMIWYQTSF